MSKLNSTSLIENNANLKVQLITITKQIEESLAAAKVKKAALKPTENFDMQETMQYLGMVNEYKRKISALKHDLQCSMVYCELRSQENQIKEMKPKLVELKKEYDTLMKVRKNQQDGLKEIENTFNAKTELISLTEKVKNLKEESKLYKERNKSDTLRLKKQNEEIIKLNDEVKLIKENINAKKNSEGVDLKDLNEEVSALNSQVKEEEKLLKNSEKNYLKAISQQDEIIDRIDEEINILQVKIKHKEQEAKISALKLRELMKLTGETEEENPTPNTRKVKSDNNRRLVKNNIKVTNNNNYINNNVSNKKVSVTERKVPFIIKKFGKKDNKNFSPFPYSSVSITRNPPIKPAPMYPGILTDVSKSNAPERVVPKEDPEQRKNDVMLEIENLKNDIQNALEENHPEFENMNKVLLNSKPDSEPVPEEENQQKQESEKHESEKPESKKQEHDSDIKSISGLENFENNESFPEYE